MSLFKALRLNPLVTEMLGRFDATLDKSEAVPEKLDHLLEVADEVDRRFTRVALTQKLKGWLSLGAMLVAGGAVWTALSVFAPATVVLGSVAAFVVAGALTVNSTFNLKELEFDRDTLKSRIGIEALNAATATDPATMEKSPKFSAAIRTGFNQQAAVFDVAFPSAYAALRQRVKLDMPANQAEGRKFKLQVQG